MLFAHLLTLIIYRGQANDLGIPPMSHRQFEIARSKHYNYQG